MSYESAGDTGLWGHRYLTLRVQGPFRALPRRRRAAAGAGLSEVRPGADAELVALGVGHDDVIVAGLTVAADSLGAEPGEPGDFGNQVVGVLRARGDFRANRPANQLP